VISGVTAVHQLLTTLIV